MWRSGAQGLRNDLSARHPGRITSHLVGNIDASSDETAQTFLVDRMRA